MYFVSIYEKRRIKPTGIVLRSGEREERGRTMEGVNLTKIYCKHICKYHNVCPCTCYYMLVLYASTIIKTMIFQKNILILLIKIQGYEKNIKPREWENYFACVYAHVLIYIHTHTYYIHTYGKDL
jgi:hypothetical protein